GAGKSSLIRAGVIPALKRSGEGWHAITIRPGRQPLTALADALLRGLGSTALSTASGGQPGRSDGDTEPSDDQLRSRLGDQPGTLGAELRRWANRKQRKIALFVDQLEELYTHDQRHPDDDRNGSTSDDDRDTRAAFLRCLAGAADDPSSPVRVITTVRSDFLDRVVHDRGTMAAASRGLLFLPPMTRTSLRQALLEPVAAAGYRFENDDLVDHMVDALDGTPGALPLLQFTASTLWEARDRQRCLLTLASYQAMGGVAGALASHADAVLAAMPAAQRPLTRTVLQRLVTPERTRAIVTLGELHQLADPSADDAAIDRIVHHLADARLLAMEDSDQPDDAAVELIHESLITAWPTLRRWLDDSQEDAEFLARLRTASQAWDDGGRADGTLWSGQTARDALHWRERYRGEIGRRERAYLNAIAAHGRRTERRRRAVIASAFAALVALVAVVSLALYDSKRSQREIADKATELQRVSDELKEVAEQRAQALHSERRQRERAEEQRRQAEQARSAAETAKRKAAAEADRANRAARTAEQALEQSRQATGQARRAEKSAQIERGRAESERAK
ncbi:MAG: serine/threonine-protein kinase PknK, partial [Myxococcota bacterium]